MSEPNKMRNWRFDAIVMRIDAPGRCLDDKDELRVVVDFFKKCRPTITGSPRINVINFFCSHPLCDFEAERDCLRESLLLNGINFMVTYCGETIGCGHLNITKKIEQKLCVMEPPSEIIHTAEVELTKGQCTTGLMTIRFRLQIRCVAEDAKDGNSDEYENENLNLSVCDNDENYDNNGNNDDNDIFFTMQDEFNDCEDNDNDQTLMPSQAISACCEKQISPNKIRDLIDELCGKEQITCRQPKRCLKCASSTSNKSSGKDPAYNYEIQTPAHKVPRSIGDEMVNNLCPKISAPILKQTHFKTPRLCTVCHENVSWLPKFATCPYCDYKPVPVVEEKPYNEEAMADDILGHQLQLTPDAVSSELSERDCRQAQREVKVKGISDDEFDSLIKNFKFLKNSLKKTQEGLDDCAQVPKSIENQDSKPATGEARPHLAQVFLELKTLFEAKKSKSKTSTLNKICQDACKLTKSLIKNRKRRGATEKKIEQLCEPPKPKAKKKSRRKFKQIKSRVYSTITMKRGSQARLGHKTCINGYSGGRKNVPGHMGWLWTSSALAHKPGWKPGAIRRSIRELMGYFLKDFPVDGIPVSKYMSYLKGKRPPPPPRKNEEKEEDLVQHPTLHVVKKDDEYIITLRPLKNPNDIMKCANPYVDMKPVQFRIVKDPLLKQLRDMKRCLKEMGFSKCTCHRPVMECYCRSFVDKKLLLHELNKECKKRELEGCEEKLVLSETTDSEAEFDFSVTPPAGLIKPHLLKKVDLMNSETQYKDEDWVMQSRFPQPPNALVQYHCCAMGERRGLFKYIYGKGKINRDDDEPKKKKKKPKVSKGKRLKGGGSGYVGSYSEDSSETPISHVTFEARRMGPPAKTLSKAYAPTFPFTQPQMHKGITMRPRPLSEARIKRLTLASIPPAARGIDVNGHRFMGSPSFTASSINTTNIEYVSSETGKRPVALAVPHTGKRLKDLRGGAQTVNMTNTNSTTSAKSAAMPHLGQTHNNNKVTPPRGGAAQTTKVTPPRKSQLQQQQQPRSQPKKSAAAVSAKSSKNALRRRHASPKTHRFDKNPAATERIAEHIPNNKITATSQNRPTVSRSRTKTELQAKRVAFKPVTKSGVGAPTKSGKILETKRSIR